MTKAIEEKDTADIRKERATERIPVESVTGSTGIKQNTLAIIHKTKNQNSTPPPLGWTSGGSPPQRWQILLQFFLNDLRGTRNGGFLNHILNSGRLGTVDLDRRRELNRSRDSCNTGICWGGSTEDRRRKDGVTVSFSLGNGPSRVFCFDFSDYNRFLERRLWKV